MKCNPGLLRGSAAAILTLTATTQAMAAQCNGGRPSFSMTAPPSCDCFNGSSPGTRVYGLIATIRVTVGGNETTLNGDASLSCNATRIVILTNQDGASHVFPIAASVRKVYLRSGVFAVFSPLAPDANMSRRIREGSAILLRTL